MDEKAKEQIAHIIFLSQIFSLLSMKERLGIFDKDYQKFRDVVDRGIPKDSEEYQKAQKAYEFMCNVMLASFAGKGSMIAALEKESVDDVNRAAELQGKMKGGQMSAEAASILEKLKSRMK